MKKASDLKEAMKCMEQRAQKMMEGLHRVAPADEYEALERVIKDLGLVKVVAQYGQQFGVEELGAVLAVICTAYLQNPEFFQALNTMIAGEAMKQVMGQDPSHERIPGTRAG